MLETLFRAFVIVQPFLWMWILEDDRFEFLNGDESFTLFSVLAMLWGVGLWLNPGFHIGLYSSEILFVYSFLVWWGILALIKNFGWDFREALATSFLLVYLNSWYWESFLHIWAIQENGINANQLFQLLHLIPGIYFLIRYEFDKNKAVDELAKGFIASTIIGLARKTRFYLQFPFMTLPLSVVFDHGLMILNRVICFVFLFNAVISWGAHKKTPRGQRLKMSS
jgi:hypothetical protein